MKHKKIRIKKPIIENELKDSIIDRLISEVLDDGECPLFEHSKKYLKQVGMENYHSSICLGNCPSIGSSDIENCCLQHYQDLVKINEGW